MPHFTGKKHQIQVWFMLCSRPLLLSSQHSSELYLNCSLLHAGKGGRVAQTQMQSPQRGYHNQQLNNEHQISHYITGNNYTDL